SGQQQRHLRPHFRRASHPLRLTEHRMRLLALTLLLSLSSAAPATGTEAVSATATRTGTPTAPPEPEGFWNGPTNDPVPNTIKGGKVIHTQALAALLKRKDPKAIVVDVSNGPRRPDELPITTTWLPVPHQAIPGALWIPGAGLGEPPLAV